MILSTTLMPVSPAPCSASGMSQNTTNIMFIMWQFSFTYLLLMPGSKRFLRISPAFIFFAAVILLAGGVRVEIVISRIRLYSV